MNDLPAKLAYVCPTAFASEITKFSAFQIETNSYTKKELGIFNHALFSELKVRSGKENIPHGTVPKITPPHHTPTGKPPLKERQFLTVIEKEYFTQLVQDLLGQDDNECFRPAAEKALSNIPCYGQDRLLENNGPFCAPILDPKDPAARKDPKPDAVTTRHYSRGRARNYPRRLKKPKRGDRVAHQFVLALD